MSKITSKENNGFTVADLHELRLLIDNTTQGEWYFEDDDWTDGDCANITCDVRDGMLPIATLASGGSVPDCSPSFAAEQQANARFIASFNPAIVGALLDELLYYKSLPGIYFASPEHLAKVLHNVSGLHEISAEYIAEDVFTQFSANRFAVAGPAELMQSTETPTKADRKEIREGIKRYISCRLNEEGAIE